MSVLVLIISIFSGDVWSSQDKLRVSDPLLALIDQFVDRDASAYRRINQLEKMVFGDEGLHLQYAYRSTTMPDETAAAGQGDCVAFSLLFVALAREIGLDARFQEIRGTSGWRRIGGYNMQTIHMNVSVLVGHRAVEVDFARFQSMKGISQRLISEDQAFAHYHNNLGVEAILSNRLEPALSHFERAVELAPRFSGCWANLGVCYRRSGRHDDAREAYLTAWDLEPKSPVISANLAQLLFSQGCRDAAERIYAGLARSKFQNPFYQYNRGVIAFAKDDLDEAEKRFRKAIKMLPEIGGFHHALNLVDQRRLAESTGQPFIDQSGGALVSAAGGGGCD